MWFSRGDGEENVYRLRPLPWTVDLPPPLIPTLQPEPDASCPVEQLAACSGGAPAGLQHGSSTRGPREGDPNEMNGSGLL